MIELSIKLLSFFFFRPSRKNFSAFPAKEDCSAKEINQIFKTVRNGGKVGGACSHGQGRCAGKDCRACPQQRFALPQRPAVHRLRAPQRPVQRLRAGRTGECSRRTGSSNTALALRTKRRMMRNPPSTAIPLSRQTSPVPASRMASTVIELLMPIFHPRNPISFTVVGTGGQCT